MSRNKKLLLIMVLSIIIFILTNFLYSKYLVKDIKYELYILTRDVKRGDIINKNDLKKIYVNENIDNVLTTKQLTDDIKLVASQEILKGSILSNKNTIETDKYLKANENKEIISISFKKADDLVSYNIMKDNIVNIYFTAKSKYINQIDIKNTATYIDTEEGYGTIELLKNIRVLEVFNKEGVSIKQENGNVNNIIDTILIEVNNEEAKTINNLKELGEFRITLIR